MKTLRLPSLIVVLLLCCSFTQLSLTQRRAVADLETIRHVFEVKYAPRQWKEEYAQWNLDQAIEEAKHKILSLSSPSMKECQVIIRDFFNSAMDYHVGVRFYSTEEASLPFAIKGAKGRYFVSFVDRQLLPLSQFPFDEGDEILMFDGRPIHDVIEDLRVQEFGVRTVETDHALAEIALTHRSGDMGQRIPKGNVYITGKKNGQSRLRTIKLQWIYIPERIRDFSKIGVNADSFDHHNQFGEKPPTSLKMEKFFQKMMCAYFWNSPSMRSLERKNKHMIGARNSFVPELGKKLWEVGQSCVFNASIYETPTGKKVGYIRIPHYSGDWEEVMEFGEIMNFFQQHTDALVIDQVNNPGGSIFYLYALASTLTDKPLYSPKHRITMTQEEVYTAHMWLYYLENVTNDETARNVLGDNIGGCHIDFEYVRLMRKFCEFLIQQWNSGSLFTEPTFLFGIDKIKPHPEYHYDKPILILVNSLCFSCGDFFPAILQDNQRVKVMGTRTAGAGGYVMFTEFPNHSGMSGFIMTGSIAERIDHKPIENLGVTPDIHYELTPHDLQNNYEEYVGKILESVESLI